MAINKFLISYPARLIKQVTCYKIVAKFGVIYLLLEDRGLLYLECHEIKFLEIYCSFTRSSQ